MLKQICSCPRHRRWKNRFSIAPAFSLFYSHCVLACLCSGFRIWIQYLLVKERPVNAYPCNKLIQLDLDGVQINRLSCFICSDILQWATAYVLDDTYCTIYTIHTKC